MVVRRFMDHQHVLVQLPVRKEAGEALVQGRQRVRRQGLGRLRRRHGFKGRFKGQAFFLLRRGQRCENGTAGGEVAALDRKSVV